MLWKLRNPEPGDVSFVFNSWLRSFRDAPAMHNMNNDVYFKGAHNCIEKVAQAPTSRVVVASDPQDNSVIYGYGVGELQGTELIIHFIYVKHSFRGFGLGTALEAELLKTAHVTKTFSCYSKLTRVLLKNRKDYNYNPFHFWSRS